MFPWVIMQNSERGGWRSTCTPCEVSTHLPESYRGFATCPANAAFSPNPIRWSNFSRHHPGAMGVGGYFMTPAVTIGLRKCFARNLGVAPDTIKERTTCTRSCFYSIQYAHLTTERQRGVAFSFEQLLRFRANGPFNSQAEVNGPGKVITIPANA